MGTERAIDRIKAVHIPLWLQRFEEKAADYNDTGDLPFEPHTVLGIRGQFADLWRKVWKLKRALWDGQKLKGEQPIEIIDDLIAHLFLTRDLLVMEIPTPGEVADTLALARKPSDPDTQVYRCGVMCSPRSHTFAGECRYRLASLERSDA